MRQLLLSRDYSAAPNILLGTDPTAKGSTGTGSKGSAEASGGIWNWHIPQQSSTQLSAKSSATMGTHGKRGPVLTAGAPHAPTVPLESAFSWMKHQHHAQYPAPKGPDALERDPNLKQAWISPTGVSSD